MAPFLVIITLSFNFPVDCTTLQMALGQHARVVSGQPLSINYRCGPWVPTPVVPIPDRDLPPPPPLMGFTPSVAYR